MVAQLHAQAQIAQQRQGTQYRSDHPQRYFILQLVSDTIRCLPMWCEGGALALQVRNFIAREQSGSSAFRAFEQVLALETQQQAHVGRPSSTWI